MSALTNLLVIVILGSAVSFKVFILRCRCPYVIVSPKPPLSAYLEKHRGAPRPPKHILCLPHGLLLVGHAWNTSFKRHPRGILVRSPNHFNCLLLMGEEHLYYEPLSKDWTPQPICKTEASRTTFLANCLLLSSALSSPWGTSTVSASLQPCPDAFASLSLPSPLTCEQELKIPKLHLG